MEFIVTYTFKSFSFYSNDILFLTTLVVQVGLISLFYIILIIIIIIIIIIVNFVLLISFMILCSYYSFIKISIISKKPLPVVVSLWLLHVLCVALKQELFFCLWSTYITYIIQSKHKTIPSNVCYINLYMGSSIIRICHILVALSLKGGSSPIFINNQGSCRFVFYGHLTKSGSSHGPQT